MECDNMYSNEVHDLDARIRELEFELDTLKKRQKDLVASELERLLDSVITIRAASDLKGRSATSLESHAVYHGEQYILGWMERRLKVRIAELTGKW